MVIATLAAMLASSAFVLATPRVSPAPIDDAAVQSQAEAVATVSLASRAVDKLGLATNPEFGGDCGGRRPLPVRD